MPASRGRRSTSVAKRPFTGARVGHARHVGVTAKIGPARKKYLRKLLSDLMTVIDEKEKFSTEDDAVDVNAEEVDSERRSDNGEFEENDKNRRVKSVDTPQGEEIRRDEKDQAHYEAKNVARFLELCETHVQLTHNIRGLFNALGGGGRAANAVEQMNKAIAESRNAFTTTISNRTASSDMFSSITVDVHSCTQSLRSYSEAAEETDKTFRELGFFNSDFFNALHTIRNEAEIIIAKVDGEYGNVWDCRVDLYLDTTFETLVRDLDIFIVKLKNVAENEISALRQSQDFLTQRYLNLTTIATFLSSVTATTLQITADDGDTGPLTLVTSTMWFISLVFSTSSAVYSLLVMTWRQSSVRQPESVLPASFRVWLRNGPMYALIASLMAFSIGLCLLAFRVGDQKGLQVSAAIPTAFAGIHAYVILVLSAWFLFEQWRGKHAGKWQKIRDVYAIPLQRTREWLPSSSKELLAAAKQRLLDSISMFTSLPLSRTGRRAFKGGAPTTRSATSDVELGETGPTLLADSASGRYVSAPPAHVAVDDLAHELPSHETLDQLVDAPPAAEATALESSPWITDETGVVSEGKNGPNADEQPGEEEPTYRPLENLLRFSPHGNFLAFACKCTVTIYDGNRPVSVLTAFDTPDKDEVKAISWSSSYLGYKLLVRSVTSVSIWEVTMQSLVKLVGHLREAVASARWIIKEESDEDEAEGFVCSSGLSVKLFDNECEEVWSVGIGELRDTTCVLDASLIRKNYLFCLAQVADDLCYSRLLLINMKDRSIQSEHKIAPGQTSMVVSLKSKDILLLGDDDGAEIANLSISEPGAHLDILAGIRTLWHCTWGANELMTPERAVVFHGGGDKLITGYSHGEIVTLYHEPGDSVLSALHRFTTPTAGPMPEKLLGFAINSSHPYMFAFGDEHGSVTIWSIQSNVGLDKCPSARTFDVHDRPGVRYHEPIISTGKFLILPPPATP